MFPVSDWMPEPSTETQNGWRLSFGGDSFICETGSALLLRLSSWLFIKRYRIHLLQAAAAAEIKDIQLELCAECAHSNRTLSRTECTSLSLPMAAMCSLVSILSSCCCCIFMCNSQQNVFATVSGDGRKGNPGDSHIRSFCWMNTHFYLYSIYCIYILANNAECSLYYIYSRGYTLDVVQLWIFCFHYVFIYYYLIKFPNEDTHSSSTVFCLPSLEK